MWTRTGADGGWVAGAAVLAAGVDPLAGADVLGEPRLYWERPLAQEAAAGWGEAGVAQAREAREAGALLVHLASAPGAVRWTTPVPEGMPGPWFGGMRFAAQPSDDAAWAPFGAARFVLPELLVWRAGKQLAAAAFVPAGPGAEERVRTRLERAVREVPAHFRHPREADVAALERTSSREAFEARVGRALEAIRSGMLEKVVLARSLDVAGPEAFPLVDVLARLREQNPRCATFLVRGADGSAFLGGTPETLLRLEGQTLATEALAGSASPAQAAELPLWDKERREHRAVVDGIRQALSPLAADFEAAETPEVLALKNVVHLRTPVRVRLREGVGLADAVGALHPTPAVGGTPRPRALGFLAEHEGLDRGWYAGPVGWVGPGRAHLAVALRSARVQGAHARLFVGAGIVAGSSAEAEWRETELKSLAMLRALGGVA